MAFVSHTPNILLINNSSQGFGCHSPGTVNPVVTGQREGRLLLPGHTPCDLWMAVIDYAACGALFYFNMAEDKLMKQIPLPDLCINSVATVCKFILDAHLHINAAQTKQPFLFCLYRLCSIKGKCPHCCGFRACVAVCRDHAPDISVVVL